MAKDPKVDLIASVSLFGGCRTPDFREIAQLMDEVDLPAGHVLMRQGDHGREMFVIASGSVSIERDGRDLGTRGPGTTIGEMALISEGPRTATVTVVEPSRLLVAGHREFHALMERHPTIRTRILEAMAEKVRNLEPGAAH